MIHENTNENLVLKYLEKNGSITSREAFGMGVTRLAAAIFVLKKNGIHIISETEECVNRNGNKARYSRYYLVFDEDKKND